MTRRTWLLGMLLGSLGLYYFTHTLEDRVSKDSALSRQAVTEVADPVADQTVAAPEDPAE